MNRKNKQTNKQTKTKTTRNKQTNKHKQNKTENIIFDKNYFFKYICRISFRGHCALFEEKLPTTF